MNALLGLGKAVLLLGVSAFLVSGITEPEQVTALAKPTVVERGPATDCDYFNGVLLWRNNEVFGCAETQAQTSDFIKNCYMDGLEVTVPKRGHLLCNP